MMIIFDTETTGLVQPHGTPIKEQPHIIEFAAIKLDKRLCEAGRFETLINPGMPLPKVITEITGLTDGDLKDAPSFAKVYPDLCEFFLGEKACLAHNAPFDLNLMYFDLRRIGKHLCFPWPFKQLCSIELTRHLSPKKAFRMIELYKYAFGKELDQKHRAMSDVEALVEIVKWMVSKDLIK